MRPTLRDLLVGGVLCLLSLVAGASALVLAEFGAPVWVFALLLVWLLTLGLPTLVAVLLLAGFWPGPSFQTYLVAAALLALFLQFGAVSAIRRGLAPRRVSER
jgi:drug/metabolite transporter (DMT)-like permease